LHAFIILATRINFDCR